jgi:hypothetical protein
MRAHLLCIFLLVLVAGCGGSTHGSVSGIVTMDGQPVANALVTFQPTGTDPGPGSYGRTNDKGEYSLEIIGGGRGAVVGWHNVMIRPELATPPGPKGPLKFVIKGESKFEVKSGSNTASFEVTAPIK